MSNELQTSLDAILNDKNTNLLPENLKAGITCLGVNGNFDGTKQTIQQTMIIADYKTINNSKEDAWMSSNFKTYFNIPERLNGNKYVSGVSYLDGVYKRWLVIVKPETMQYDAISMSSVFNLPGETGSIRTGIAIEVDKIVKCFKFEDIKLDSFIDEYGKDELGVECSPEDLPFVLSGSSSYQYYMCVIGTTTELGYIGQNCTYRYYTEWGEKLIFGDILDTSNILNTQKVYDNTGTEKQGTLELLFTICSGYGKELTTDDSRVYTPFELDTKYLFSLPDDISIKDKYYVIYEVYNNMMDRYMHEFVIVIADKPMELRANNYYEYGKEMTSEGYPQYLWICGTPEDTSIKGYRFEINDGTESEHHKFIGIFGENDILWNYFDKYTRLDCSAEMNTTTNVITLRYTPYSSSWVLNPSYETADRGAMRLITNCNVVRMSNNDMLLDNSKSGTDTSDATATADDITQNKTAYANGQKITGTIDTHGGTDVRTMSGSEVSDNWTNPHGDPQQKYVSFKVKPAYMNGAFSIPAVDSKPICFKDNAELAVLMSQHDVAEAIGLTADKIKAGETILGITGTYTGEDVSL